jgi:dTDP-L-rhamnose 4-epimerase
LIGSHLSDLLLEEGYGVRIFDNLEPQTHRNGKPPWVPTEVEFVNADIRDRTATRAALEGVDVVFHQAAYGGYMPQMGKYVQVNSFGTAQMLEIIRDDNLPVKKVVVASSQAVYREGAANCPEHGLVFPETRPSNNSRPGTTPRIARSAVRPRRRLRRRRRPRRGARRSTPSRRQTRSSWS